jgi:hypothetical protein
MTDDTPQVEQRHREAAASYYAAMAFGADKASILAQMLDREATDEEWIDPLSYLFARFEATHLATLTAERDAAREALESARKPTAEMLDAGGFATFSNGNRARWATLNKDDRAFHIKWAGEIWRAMFDAALADAPGTQEGE